jgi:peptidoglycan/LPS O-acetylase OafA/YrhL
MIGRIALRTRLKSSSRRDIGQPSSFRRDIQGLRMIAVVAVIMDHLLGWPAGGFVGVDVFFVISGFLITGLLLREHEKTGGISFSAFYRNRIRRIAPAATLVLLVTVCTAWALFSQGRFMSTAVDSLWAFLFAANWHFAAQGTDYFEASGPESPLQHFWSLAVEEQFYFIWPWVMLLIFVTLARYSRQGRDQARLIVGLVLAVAAGGSFAWAMFETANMPTWAYFSTASRAWELGVGALVAVFASKLAVLSGPMRSVLGYGGLAGVIASLFVVSDAVSFPAPWAALPVLSTAAVIVAGTGGPPSPIKFLTNPVAGYIGKISYSLYLWHFPVIVFYTTVIGDSMLDIVGCTVVFTLAAIYSFHLVEDPIRRSNWLVKNGWKQNNHKSRNVSERYKLMLLSLVALVTIPTVWSAVTPAQAPQGASIAIPSPSSAEQEAAQSPELARLQIEIAAALRTADWPKLAPSLDEVMAGPQAPEEIGRCGRGPVDEVACTWGDPDAKHTIVTVGNSISMTYVSALRSAIGTSSDWKVVSYGMFGCPFGDSASIATLKILPDGCSQRADDAVAAINRMRPELVVLSGVYESAKEKLKGVDAPSKFIFLPGPPTDKDLAACYSKVSSPADCITTIPPGWGAVEKNLARSVPNGIYVNSVPWFCYDGSCPSFAGRIPTKLDRDHMTAAFAVRLGPVIRESLQEHGLLAGMTS